MKDVFAPNGGVFLCRLTQLVTSQGHDLETALGDRVSFQSGLPSGTLSIPAHEHAILLETAEELTGDREIGFTLAQASNLRQAGLSGYAIGACSSVGEALHVLIRLSDVFFLVTPDTTSATSAEVKVGPVSGQVELCWDYGSSGKLDLRHWSEFTAALLVQGLKDLTGGQAMPLAVGFTHHAPRNLGRARQVLGTQPTYLDKVNRLIFAEKDLALPLLHADPGLLQVLLEHADLIRRVEDLERNTLSIAVERLIMDGMTSGDASLAKVSESLGVSQRTLSRKLASEGTSFFAILEGVRKSLAFRYLRQNEKSLSEISVQLGYSSLSSFNDAFRRWTGQSPGSYRTTTTRQS